MPAPRRLAGALVALLLVVGACSSSSDEPAVDAAAAPPKGEPTAVPGFDGVTIHVGAITASTGPAAAAGVPATRGAQVWFQYVNTELGGIGGKYQVAVDVLDAGADPDRAAGAYADLVPRTVLLTQVVGAPVVGALLPSLRTDDVLAAPLLAAGDLREPNLLPTGVPVGVQAANGLSWYLDHHARDAGTVCSVVQEDAFGDAGQAGLATAAARLHATLGPELRVPAPPDEPGDAAPVIVRLRDARCAAVALVASPTAGAAVLAAASGEGLDVQWLAVGAAWTSTLRSSPAAGYLQDHLAVVTEGPSYGDGRHSADMVELVRMRAAYAPDLPPDPWFEAGLLQAKAVTAVLEAAVRRGDLSRAGVLAASQAVGRVTSKGLVGPFTYGPPAKRVPPTTSSISAVDPDNPTGLGVTDAAVRVPFAAALLDAP